MQDFLTPILSSLDFSSLTVSLGGMVRAQAMLETFPALQGLISVIKLIAGVFSIAALIAIIVVIARLNRLWFASMMQNVTASIRAETLPLDKISRQWQAIRSRIEKHTEAEWKLAVIEADKLVDDILKKMGYPGDSLEDRLKNVKEGQVQSIGALRAAHTLRNTIVNDPEFYVSELEVKNAIDYYQTFLKEIEVIELA